MPDISYAKPKHCGESRSPARTYLYMHKSIYKNWKPVTGCADSMCDGCVLSLRTMCVRSRLNYVWSVQFSQRIDVDGAIYVQIHPPSTVISIFFSPTSTVRFWNWNSLSIWNSSADHWDRWGRTTKMLVNWNFQINDARSRVCGWHQYYFTLSCRNSWSRFRFCVSFDRIKVTIATSSCFSRIKINEI